MTTKRRYRNILYGMGSIMDICPRRKLFFAEKLRKPMKHPLELLYEDSAKVGQDLWTVFRKLGSKVTHG